MLIKLTQPPQQEGQTIQVITALAENITFAAKRPLEPMFNVIMGDMKLPCLGNYDELADKLLQIGFSVFEGGDGSRVVLNPLKVCTFMSPQIGVYALMLKGRASIAVKATRAEIEALFEKKSSILLD